MQSLSEAAALCGVAKTTLWRAIKTGKISAQRDEHGQWMLDPAEVTRVYPVPPKRSDHDEAKQSAAAFAALETAVAMLREQLAIANKSAEDWRAMAMRSLPAPRSWWKRLAG